MTITKEDLQAQLQAKAEQHNQLASQIQEANQQLLYLKAQIQVLSELSNQVSDETALVVEEEEQAPEPEPEPEPAPSPTSSKTISWNAL